MSKPSEHPHRFGALVSRVSRVSRVVKEWEAYERRAEFPFYVGGPLLTLVFWAIVGVFITALWLSPILPFGDYPYHLSLSAILRRMASPGSIERQIYETNLVSYNSLFHITVAGLGFIMPIESAGLVVYSGYWIGLCLAVLSLLRALKMPTERAYILFPLFLTLPAAWGFLNFCIAVALQFYVLARVIRRPRVGARLRYDVVTSLVALLSIWSHLMGSAVGYALVLIALLVRTMADRSPFVVTYVRTFREGFPFLPPIVAAFAVYHHQEAGAIKAAVSGTRDAFALLKAENFFAFTCDYYADLQDATRLRTAILILLACALFRAPPRPTPYPSLRAWLLFGATLIYFLCPERWWSTAILFQRVAFIVVILLALALPRAFVIVEKGAAVGLAGIGLSCAMAFFGLRSAQRPDLRDLLRVIDDAPPGRKLALDASQATPLERQQNSWAGHLAVYYVTRKGAEAAVNYANKMSLPIRYKNGVFPPLADDALAQGALRYNPKEPYARRFDLVLVRTSSPSGPNPATTLWAGRPESIELLSHHGKWWLFDARRYFESP